MNQFLNVRESWPYYDTLIVSEELYGSERNLGGFFTTFTAFAERSDHSLFKVRSEALAGLAYNNQSSQDRMDFAFRALSFGITFWAPAHNPQWGTDTPAVNPQNDCLTSIFWQNDLPRMVGVELRIGQDVKLTGQAMRMPPGYGPSGGGLCHGADEGYIEAGGSEPSMFSNAMNLVGTQGVADVSNRFIFRPPIPIPRNSSIELKIYLSDIARRILANTPGPGHAFVPQDVEVDEGTTWTLGQLPGRFGIQASLWGIREVQQRGQTHV